MKTTSVVIGIIALLIGGALGYALNENNTSSNRNEPDNHMEDNHHDTGHSHGMLYEVDATNAPSVEFTVEEDAKSGWNITLETSNFTFTPESVNGENVPGEGHAHLYVDGEKVARLYGPNFHYDKSFDGSKEFRIELNANDHSVYAVDGDAVEATQIITHDHHN